jgi:hypothetical protein
VRGDVPVDSEAFLVTDFVNLKIKPAQPFEGVYRGSVCVHMFIGVSAHTCMSIYVCTVFLKKIFTHMHFMGCFVRNAPTPFGISRHIQIT